MHSHDDALIAALAEGSLDPGQVPAVEAEIAECARCSAALAAQRTALEALRSAPAALLGDDERTVLRAAVAESLGLDTRPVPAARRRRSIPWGAVAVAAASLAAIVAIVPLAGLLSTAADSDDAATALAVTTAADAPGLEDAGAREPIADEGTQADLAETAAGAESEGMFDSVPEPAVAVTSTTTAPNRADAITLDDLAAALATGELEPLLVTDDEPASCAEEAEAALGPGASALSRPVLVEGISGVAYLADDGSAAAVFDAGDCRRLAVLP